MQKHSITTLLPHEPHSASEPLISADGIGVRYDVHLRRAAGLRGNLRRLRGHADNVKALWALRDVSFQIGQGECIAIIGANGAGKTTLLQTLAGILMPAEGKLHVNGSVSTLLTMAPGFDSELTGRENILLGGAFMGIDHRQMRNRLEEICEFSELGEFIDAPIKHYSSGMRARLAFSVAATIEPEILILDEILGTGDASFREKSRVRIQELVASAGAVVMGTHDLPWAAKYASRVLLLEKGRLLADAGPAPVIRLYRNRIARTDYACPTCSSGFEPGTTCRRCGMRWMVDPASLRQPAGATAVPALPEDIFNQETVDRSFE